MLKLKLQQPKRHPLHRDKILPWSSCAPFVENSQWRADSPPRSAQTITIHREPHMAVQYWCGNGIAGKRNLTFLAAPPDDKLLCGSVRAQRRSRRPAERRRTRGRHVHIGKIKAQCKRAAWESHHDHRHLTGESKR